MVDYVGFSSLPPQSHYSTLPPTQRQRVQGQRQSSSPNLRRTSTRGPRLAVQSPSMRDRTPIRHHGSSLPRDSSSTRQEALLAYVSVQQNQQSIQQQGQRVPVLASQTDPSASMMFHNPTYGVQTSEPYASQSVYYHSPHLQHVDTQYLTQPQVYGGGTPQMSYYPLQSSNLHLSSSSGPAFHPQETLYAAPALPSAQPSQPAAGSIGSSMLQPALPTPAPLESSREHYQGSAARPKPQCFEHGCNGREFSTFSNLLRHQRERSGNATKSVCPHCGTEFTRTTARNGHLTSGKCKGRPDQGQSGSDQGT